MDRTYAIYVQPPYDSAVYALIRYYKWQHVYYLYDTEQGLSLSLSLPIQFTFHSLSLYSDLIFSYIVHSGAYIK